MLKGRESMAHSPSLPLDRSTGSLKITNRLKWLLAGLGVAVVGGLLVMINAGPGPASVAEVTAKFPRDVKPIHFDRDRAFGYLKTICDLGPRISGSGGMKR